MLPGFDFHLGTDFALDLVFALCFDFVRCSVPVFAVGSQGEKRLGILKLKDSFFSCLHSLVKGYVRKF